MKRSANSHLPFATLTDPGLTRDHNEDRLMITAFEAESDLIPDSLLCVLCDGVGGHNAGETAAEMAVTGITEYIEQCDGSSPLTQLSTSIQAASDAVFKAASSTNEMRGMASTAVCAWIIGNRLFTATVGDSRIYLVRGKQIHQLSTDHTWIKEALDAGLISPEEAVNHPNAHVIRKYIGSEIPPEVDVHLRYGEDGAQNLQGMLLEQEDILFLCSDGVTDLLKDDEIKEFLLSLPIKEALESIKQLVFERGAHDNLTMIAVKIPITSKELPKKAKRLRLVVFGFILLAAALIGIILGWMALSH